MITDFDDWVASYADATLSSFPKALFGAESEQRNAVLELRAELTARVSHWKAEARSYARSVLKRSQLRLPTSSRDRASP